MDATMHANADPTLHVKINYFSERISSAPFLVFKVTDKDEGGTAKIFLDYHQLIEIRDSIERFINSSVESHA